MRFLISSLAGSMSGFFREVSAILARASVDRHIQLEPIAVALADTPSVDSAPKPERRPGSYG
jgi:hypothetical protein